MNKENVKLGNIMCFGEENGVSYEVYLNNDFLYTIIVKKNDKELIETHQGVRAIFGWDVFDVQWVNEKMDRMINELKQQ